MIVKPVKLTPEAYSAYGNIIAADDALPFKPANMGTAKRFNHLSAITNLRAEQAQLNMCVFRVSPVKEWPLELKLLEKHHFSTQVFLPMNNTAKYLVIVALGDDEPDLNTLSAFVAEGAQGISYKPGIWHYPMTAINEQIDFACLIWEDGSPDDCQISKLSSSIHIDMA